MNTPAVRDTQHSATSAAHPGREDLQRELAKLPGKLKAKLVVEALETARKKGRDKAGRRSELAKRNNVSDALFLELLKEFKSDLDKARAGKPAAKEKTQHASDQPVQAPMPTIKTGGSDGKPLQLSDYAQSLNHENPIIGAAIISRLSTVQAVNVLGEMRPKQSQRVALRLAENEAMNHQVPQKTVKMLDGLCRSLRG
jgi:flagellar FliG-like protein